eukprot:scaffold162877_cov24-Tisochrysis_lutea.AAC.1
MRASQTGCPAMEGACAHGAGQLFMPDVKLKRHCLRQERGTYSHSESTTERQSVFGPRVFMSTKGSTVTLSHTPSMPIVDREVQEAAAAAVANSGQ